ncbi:MAG: discoidin domain-containing protein [Gammaproteobacteria bacterium]|nr:discoidin domain-containing protein [Gammaproteobacteria bacterium]
MSTQRITTIFLPAIFLALVLSVLSNYAFAADGLPVRAVTASSNDGNVPANTLDNNLTTRWAAGGDGQWIRFDLGAIKTINAVAIGFYKGTERQARFDLRVSSNGSIWTTVFSGQSGGQTLAQERFEFAFVQARYVRYVGHGNTSNNWNSLTEVDIYGPTAVALTVARSGSGTVSSVPAGINCGATCSATYAVGTSVTLSAIPASGYSFSGWGGACAGVSATCTVVMTAARNVIATFAAVLPPSNVQIDFTAPLQSLSPLSLGSCISTFADGGTNLIKGPDQPLWRQYLQDLGPLVWRIPLYYHDGQVGSSAGGLHGGNDGTAYINAIKAISGTPMIAIGGSTNDNDVAASDAASLVRYFNNGGDQNSGPVDYYVIGNEPDNDFGVSNYIFGGNGSSGFHAIVGAMRTASTRPLTIAGPALNAWATYKFDDFRAFFANANADVDIVDFHKYGDGAHYDNLNRTGQYADAVKWLRAEIDSSFGTRANTVAIQVGEFNYHPRYDGWADAFYTSRNLVHTASVIGQVLRQGGRAYQFSDSNGPLGLITDGTGNNDQPNGQHVRLPAYWGLSAWTGGAWMHRYGTILVTADTTLPDVEVYATDNTKKIILINKSTDTDRTATIRLKGKDSGIYSAWQYVRGMDPTAFSTGPQFQPPARIATAQSFAAGALQIDVPWMSVVVITVD